MSSKPSGDRVANVVGGDVLVEIHEVEAVGMLEAEPMAARGAALPPR